MAEQSGNSVLGFLGGLADAFAEVRIAETDAELERLRFTDQTVTNRPERTVDESAASQRNFFGLTQEQERTAVTGGVFVGGAIVVGIIAFMAFKN